MTDTRSSAEKLQAEADTESRVKTEAALAFLRGQMDTAAKNNETPIQHLRMIVTTVRDELASGRILQGSPIVEAFVASCNLLLAVLPPS